MANTQVSVNMSLQVSGGLSLARALANQGANATVLLDDVFTAGTIDLAPHLASIGVPKYILILVGNTTGATVNLDGAGASSMKVRSMMLEVTSASPADIELVTTESARIQVLALGDPDA